MLAAGHAVAHCKERRDVEEEGPSELNQGRPNPGALAPATRSCSNAAVVKKIEPMKYVIAAATSESSEAPGSDAIAKQAEPIMNSTPIRRASPWTAPAAITAAEPALMRHELASAPHAGSGHRRHRALGSALCDALLARGDEVVGLTRDPEQAKPKNPTVTLARLAADDRAAARRPPSQRSTPSST